MFPLPWNRAYRKKNGSLSTIDAEIQAAGEHYQLPTASAETKGGIKIGSGLSMEGEVLNNSNPTPYSLPTASSETLGGVKVGSGLEIEDGVLSATGGQTVTPNYTTGRLECGTSGDWKYYIEMSREYVGTGIEGYEIINDGTSEGSGIFSILYAEDQVVSKTKLEDLPVTSGQSYSTDYFTLSKVSTNFSLTILDTCYKTDGTTWSNTTWGQAATVDHILLTESPV